MIAEPTFDVNILIDGKKQGQSFVPTTYELAKDNLKKMAEDLFYSWKEQGKTTITKCTFGGVSRKSDPIPEEYRKICPEALMIHVQSVQWTAKRIVKVIYELKPHIS